ncbi:MAG: hypothetical protein ACKVS8_06685 [Phycisphaerales bacterium]
MRYQFASLVVALAGTSGAMAQTLRIDTNGFTVSPGGEFTATPLTGSAGVVGLLADLSPTTFETFCVEANEHYRPGDTYAFVINTGAVQGGVGGQTSPNFDPLDPRTAYLYHHFRNKTLALFDYSAGGRQGSAGALQQAIWFIENEGGTNNAFVALAEAAILGGAWSGIGDVRVLNLSNGEFPNAQDQLTIVPGGIPTPGAGLLASLGLAAAARRRR